MFNRYFSFIFSFLIFFFMFFSFGSALNISGCMDINSDYFGQTITLEQNIASWSGNCFTLQSSDDTNYFELDCNYKSITSDATSINLFDTNNLDINRIAFKNCNIYSCLNFSTSFRFAFFLHFLSILLSSL